MKISVCLIVKNEECCLEKCLESVKGVDEIIVCDTGSTDSTLEIAKKYTEKVFTDFTWCDDFSMARNHANSKATGDWIFTIDADHELVNSVKELKLEIMKADLLGHESAYVKAGGTHKMAVLFKNTPKIKWVGECHECLNVLTGYDAKLEMKIGRSKTHDTDPGRNLRILLTSPKTTRNKFYLGRTYFEMGNHLSAIFWMQQYVKESVWLSEKADAFLVIARCYWALSSGDEARKYCLRAIEINSNFKDAILLMAEMSWEKNASTWRKFAEHCTNEDVLFKGKP